MTTIEAPTAPRFSVRLVLRVLGSALLIATASVHLDLYLTGYKHIPTIGVLFLLQVITGYLFAAAVLAIANPLVAINAAGFVLSTLGGYILSLWIGLFGFNEVRTTAGVVAGVIEVAAFVALMSSAFFGPAAVGKGITARVAALGPMGRRGVAPLGALALLALILAVANSPGTSSGPTTTAPKSATGSTGTTGAEMKVTISNFAFVPASFTVTPGEKIVVTNKDSVTHTFTAMPGTSGTFSSGNIAPNATKTVVAPTKKGSYSFYCAIHPFMTGMVSVK